MRWPQAQVLCPYAPANLGNNVNDLAPGTVDRGVTVSQAISRMAEKNPALFFSLSLLRV